MIIALQKSKNKFNPRQKKFKCTDQYPSPCNRTENLKIKI